MWMPVPLKMIFILEDAPAVWGSRPYLLRPSETCLSSWLNWIPGNNGSQAGYAWMTPESRPRNDGAEAGRLDYCAQVSLCGQVQNSENTTSVLEFLAVASNSINTFAWWSSGNIFRITQFVRGIHRSLANSPHKGQWRGALMFSLICAWIKVE